jgi:hypothetical protein
MGTYMPHDDDQKHAFVVWYGTPDEVRTPKTRKEYAELMGIPDRTLYSWEQAQWFKDDVERLFQIYNLSPKRIQAVVDAMWQKAVTGSTEAAKQYMAFCERLSPTKPIVTDKEVTEMTDDELREALELAAGQ